MTSQIVFGSFHFSACCHWSHTHRFTAKKWPKNLWHSVFITITMLGKKRPSAHYPVLSALELPMNHLRMRQMIPLPVRVEPVSNHTHIYMLGAFDQSCSALDRLLSRADIDQCLRISLTTLCAFGRCHCQSSTICARQSIAWVKLLRQLTEIRQIDLKSWRQGKFWGKKHQIPSKSIQYDLFGCWFWSDPNLLLVLVLLLSFMTLTEYITWLVLIILTKHTVVYHFNNISL